MKGFVSSLSLRRKMTLAILAGSITTVGLGGLALIGIEFGTYRAQTLATAQSLARIVSANSTGALAFRDAETAGEILRNLGANPGVIAARLYVADGTPLAQFLAVDTRFAFPEPPPVQGHRFTYGQLSVSNPVFLHGDRVGTLFVVFDLERERRRLMTYAGIVLLAMLLLAGIALFVSYGLQRFVSGPILDLAAVARHITQYKDFSVRARGGGQDEVGTLTDAFNLMLQAIQTREIELDQNRQNLELAQKAGRIGSFNWFSRTDRLEWSDEMFALYGQSRRTFPGTRDAWDRLIHPDDVEPARLASRRAEAGDGTLEAEFRILWPDGTVRWMFSRSKYFFTAEGAVDRVAGVNIDITERKQFESQLVEQAQALWRSNRELEQFAYVSSHDLQEPLRKVASYAELLATKYRGRLGEEADHYIENVTDGVGRMRDLIHDLLAFSRLSRQEVPHEPVDVEGIVKRIISDLEPSILEKSAQVKIVTPLPAVTARRSQMQQLFQNLIGNALKFQADAAPRVEIGHERRPGEDVFYVRDNGIGIEETYADQIFKVFQRLHPRGRYPGTGIGLAICKKIVEQHGGKIWLSSQLGKGATFYFSIPLVPHEGIAAGDGAPPSREPFTRRRDA